MTDQLALCFDPPTARAARDSALAQVRENLPPTWMDSALALLRQFAQERETFIAEDFRVYAPGAGLPLPHHHNAWGALMSIAAKRGICRMTECNRQMTTLRSHARRSPVWRRA